MHLEGANTTPVTSAASLTVLPVLDLMNGTIVHGKAGQRDTYRPIVSRLVNSAEPLAVAQAISGSFGYRQFYLADLDAIQSGCPARDVYERLQRAGFDLWIDAGLRTSDASLDCLMETAPAAIIVGSETIRGPEDLARIVTRVDVTRAVFSLDLKEGRLLGQADAWSTKSPWEIVVRAIESCGVRRLIVLDLARVGMDRGVGTEDLCSRIKERYPNVELTAGGGVRGLEDVHRLHELGVDHVLVGSALHDGRFPHA